MKILLTLDTFLFDHLGKWWWTTFFNLTGRCGSLTKGHSPIIGNDHKWLWKDGTCSICSRTYHLPERNHVSFKNYSDIGRHEDLANLKELYKNANNDAERRSIRRAEYNIRNETKEIKAMREDLIKVTRQHEHDKIKKVHEYVGVEKKYRRKVK